MTKKSLVPMLLRGNAYSWFHSLMIKFNTTFNIKKLIRYGWILSTLFLLVLATFKILDESYPIPEIAKLKKFSQIVVDKKGRPLRAFADDQGVWRYPTDVSKVSADYLEALINFEDQNFWSHHGVNYFSMLRALKQWIVNGRAISGGSTLTMQVARILDPHQKNIGGKLWQMFRAYQLEYHYSKTEILNLYLNYAPYGGPIEGIEAAAYTYLGKSANELSTSESALLAVLPQSPSRFRPDRYPERAKLARNKVLQRLLAFGVWSESKVTQAQADLVTAQFNSRPLIAPLLARQLARQLVSENKSDTREPFQTIIQTNIDLDIQLTIADRVKDYLYRFSDNTSASAMLMDNQTLDVLAYVGAADFANEKRFGHIDMNRAIRSPGSTLKPFIYAMAMDEALIHSQSLLQDVPLSFNSYSPENFTRNYSGPVSVTNALQQSLNIPAVQVLSHLGSENFANKLENAGLKLFLPEGAKPSLSLALGGAGVKLEDLVGAYRSLAASGLAGKPRYLKNSPIEERYLLSPESAWIVAEILAEVPLEPRQKNPFLKKQKQWVAHKTGTSYGYRDAWMVAVTEKYTLAVWVGKPDGTPSPGEFGRKTAGPLVARILTGLPQDNFLKREKPETVALNTICWPLGLTQDLTDKNHCIQSKQAYLINQIAPATLVEDELSNLDANPLIVKLTKDKKYRTLPSCYQGETDEIKVALWPASLEYWLPKQQRRNFLLPSLVTSCENKIKLNQELMISGVDDQSKVRTSLKSTNGLLLNLFVNSTNHNLIWLVNGKQQITQENSNRLILKNLQKGVYTVMVFNNQGQKGSVGFEVI